MAGSDVQVSRRFCALLCSLLALCSCAAQPTLTVPSPDGRLAAEVREHICLDGPCQSLWAGRPGALILVKRLGEDSDWCDQVVWSADSGTAAFLVQGARLVAYDARTETLISETWLTDWRGESPPGRIVTELSLSSDGTFVEFSECSRAGRDSPQPPCVAGSRVIRPAV